VLGFSAHYDASSNALLGLFFIAELMVPSLIGILTLLMLFRFFFIPEISIPTLTTF